MKRTSKRTYYRKLKKAADEVAKDWSGVENIKKNEAASCSGSASEFCSTNIIEEVENSDIETEKFNFFEESSDNFDSSNSDEDKFKFV